MSLKAEQIRIVDDSRQNREPLRVIRTRQGYTLFEAKR